MITFSTNIDYIGSESVSGRLGLKALQELILNDNDLQTLSDTEITHKINTTLDIYRESGYQDVIEKLSQFSESELRTLIGKNEHLKLAEISSVVFKLIQARSYRVDETLYLRAERDYIQYFGDFGGTVKGILSEYNSEKRKLFDTTNYNQLKTVNVGQSFTLTQYKDKYYRW
jgi:hypothetical protein